MSAQTDASPQPSRLTVAILGPAELAGRSGINLANTELTFPPSPPRLSYAWPIRNKVSFELYGCG